MEESTAASILDLPPE